MDIQNLTDYNLRQLYRDLIGDDSFSNYKSVEFLYSGVDDFIKINLPNNYDECVELVIEECAKRFCKTLI